MIKKEDWLGIIIAGLLLIALAISVFPGCTYKMGYNAGVRLHQRKKDVPYTQAGYLGGVVMGFLEEYERNDKRERSKKQIEEQIKKLEDWK